MKYKLIVEVELDEGYDLERAFDEFMYSNVSYRVYGYNDLGRLK